MDLIRVKIKEGCLPDTFELLSSMSLVEEIDWGYCVGEQYLWFKDFHQAVFIYHIVGDSIQNSLDDLKPASNYHPSDLSSIHMLSLRGDQITDAHWRAIELYGPAYHKDNFPKAKWGSFWHQTGSIPRKGIPVYWFLERDDALIFKLSAG